MYCLSGSIDTLDMPGQFILVTCIVAIAMLYGHFKLEAALPGFTSLSFKDPMKSELCDPENTILTKMTHLGSSLFGLPSG